MPGDLGGKQGRAAIVATGGVIHTRGYLLSFHPDDHVRLMLEGMAVCSCRCIGAFGVPPPARRFLAAARPHVHKAVAGRGVCPNGPARCQDLFEVRHRVPEPFSGGSYGVYILHSPIQGENVIKEVGTEEGTFLTG